MNHIRTLAYIRTPRMLKGFRSSVNMTGKPQIFADIGRVRLEEYRRLNRVQQTEGKPMLPRRAL
jgi:hypothetical protein